MNNLFILLFMLSIIGQDFSAYKQSGQINSSFDFFSTDQLGNVYLVENNKITKYNSTGEFIHSYSNSLSGNISSVDVSDPLRIMLYYSDFNQIVYLDKTLSVLNDQIKLDELGLDLASTTCTSSQGGLWVYDRESEALIYFDKNLEKKLQSQRITGIKSFENSPEFMLESNKLVFMNIPELGIMIFDQFGSYIKTITIKNLDNFQIKDDLIVYLANNKLHYYNYKLLEEMTVILPEINNIKQVRKEGNNIYLADSGSCYIFQKKE